SPHDHSTINTRSSPEHRRRDPGNRPRSMLARVYGRTPPPSPDTLRSPSPRAPAGPLSETGLDPDATATPPEAATAEGVTGGTPSNAPPTTRTSGSTSTSGGTQTRSSAPLSTLRP